jgi:hypothetical protein
VESLKLRPAIKVMIRVGALAIACAGTFGCANLSNITSGQIGCPPEEIIIVEEASGWQGSNWLAECRGKRFYCTGVSAGNATQYNCTEEVSQTINSGK